MSIAEVVDVEITRETVVVTQQGFGRGLFIQENIVDFADNEVRLYTSAAAMLEDGFITADYAYKAAVAYFSQATKPADILIGKRKTPVSMVSTVTVVAANNHHYIILINDEAMDYLSDGSATTAEIRDGLIAIINGSDQPVTAASTGAATFTVTADNAGSPFTISESDADISIVTNTVANWGVAEDVNAINSGSDLGSSWFVLMISTMTSYDILQGASACEPLKKLFAYRTNADAVRDNTLNNVAAQLKDLAYAYTLGIFSGASGSGFPEAAWVGGRLNDIPGSSTWALKSLVGVAPDFLTDTQKSNLRTNNVSYYVTIGGVGITQGGKVAEGEWIDVIILVEWIRARMAENVFSNLIKAAKVPFTNQGISQVGNWVSQILRQAQENGGLAPRDSDGKAFIVNLPDASSFTSDQKASRNLTNVTWDAFLAGAIHAMTIRGVVSI